MQRASDAHRAVRKAELARWWNSWRVRQLPADRLSKELQRALEHRIGSWTEDFRDLARAARRDDDG